MSNYFSIYAKSRLGYTDDDLQKHSDVNTGAGDRKFKNKDLDILHTVWVDAISHVVSKQVTGESQLDYYKTAKS